MHPNLGESEYTINDEPPAGVSDVYSFDLIIFVSFLFLSVSPTGMGYVMLCCVMLF
jgi:hypothetical protein